MVVRSDLSTKRCRWVCVRSVAWTRFNRLGRSCSSSQRCERFNSLRYLAFLACLHRGSNKKHSQGLLKNARCEGDFGLRLLHLPCQTAQLPSFSRFLLNRYAPKSQTIDLRNRRNGHSSLSFGIFLSSSTARFVAAEPIHVSIPQPSKGQTRVARYSADQIRSSVQQAEGAQQGQLAQY